MGPGATVKLLLSPVALPSVAVTLRPLSAVKAVTGALATPLAHVPKFP